MDIDKARQFLRDNHRAVLATVRKDGRPQLSPITIGVDDEVVPSARVANTSRLPLSSSVLALRSAAKSGWPPMDAM